MRSFTKKNQNALVLIPCCKQKSVHPFLEVWEIDFLPKKNRIKYGHLRDIEKEKSVEQQIREILRNRFFFRLMVIKNEKSEAEGLKVNLLEQ